MKPLLVKYLPLDSNSSSSSPTKLAADRQKDHYSHFILRLAFASTEDLRRRFSRVEAMLFRLRLNEDSARERNEFVQSLNLEWEPIADEEKTTYASELAAIAGLRAGEDDSWLKVDWERVPDLVEGRKVLLKQGKAFVPSKEQASMVVSEFTQRLDRALNVSHVFSHLLPPATFTVADTDPVLAHSSSPSPSGRRRPIDPHLGPLVQELHNARRLVQ
jgi:DNA primase large subunit